MVFVQKSGGTVYISPGTSVKSSPEISLTMSSEMAIELRDHLNALFPIEPCAVNITQRERAEKWATI